LSGGKNKPFIPAGVQLNHMQLVDWIANNFSPEETIVQLSGGEPFLHEGLISAVEKLTAKQFNVVINTNGSLLNIFLKTYNIVPPKDAWEYQKLRLRVSWHPPMRKIEQFKEDIEQFKEVPDFLLVNYVLHPRYIEDGRIEQHLEDLKNLGFPYEITGFQGEYNCRVYDKNAEEYMPYLTEAGPAVPVNYFSVQANGDIKQCHRFELGDLYGSFCKKTKFDTVCADSKGNSTCGAVNSFYRLGLIEHGTVRQSVRIKFDENGKQIQ
jgi:organic radical activating enzyme